MLIVIAVMIAGVFVGHLLKKNKRLFKFIGKLNMWIIFLLLFVMGLSIGNNPQIIDNLSGLGVSAILIGLVSTMGSVFAAYLVYKYIFEKGEKKS